MIITTNPIMMINQPTNPTLVPTFDSRTEHRLLSIALAIINLHRWPSCIRVYQFSPVLLVWVVRISILRCSFLRLIEACCICLSLKSTKFSIDQCSFNLINKGKWNEHSAVLAIAQYTHIDHDHARLCGPLWWIHSFVRQLVGWPNQLPLILFQGITKIINGLPTWSTESMLHGV